MTTIATMKKDEDPKPSTSEINAEHEKFINTAKPVINKPKPAPPAPPKEEPKKEAEKTNDAEKATTSEPPKNPNDMEIEK